MADNWKTTTLGEIADASPYAFVDGPFGSNLPASSYTVAGVPLIRGSNLSLGATRFRSDEFVYVSNETANRLQRSCCKPLDIIFTKKGTLSQTGIVPEHGKHERYLLSGNQMKLTVDRSKADPLFVFYFVSSPPSRAKIIQDSEVTGVPKTNLTYLRTFPILLPLLAEQKAIAGVLGTLDDKIELNRRMNATLEAMARALFQNWFVDFDPVRAKLDGRKPTSLAAATAALFPASFQDSPLGPIPHGWEVKTVDEVSTVGIGKTPPRQEHHWFSENPSDVPWISIRDLGDAGVFISHTSEFLTPEAVEKFRVRRIPDDTVVLSFKLTMGRVAITDGEMLSNEAIAHFRLKPEAPFGSAYLYCYLKGFGYDQLGSTSSIATAINSDMVRGIRIVVPPKRIAEAFERTVKPLFTEIKNIRKQSRTLAVLRDTLLPKLLSGELSVDKVAA